MKITKKAKVWIGNCPVTTKWQTTYKYDLGKKMDSTSGGHISVKSEPIFKNYMRFGSAKKFPPIWDFARLCSSIRLKVMIKNVIFVLFRYQILVRRGNFQNYIKNPYQSMPCHMKVVVRCQ